MVEFEEMTTMHGEVRKRRHHSVVGTCSTMFMEEQKPGVLTGGKGMEINYDVDIGNRSMSREYLAKVEMTTSHESENVQELVVVKPTSNEKVKRDPCQLKGRRGPCLKRPKPSIKVMAPMVVMLVMMALAVPANGIEFQTPHLVTEECGSWFKGHRNDCPDKFRDDILWNEMNDICCGTLSKEKIHCQMDYYESGTMFSVAQCLPEREIPESVIGRLYLNGSGIDMSTVCSPGTYRSQSVNSTFVMYRYCTETKMKENDMQEKLCNGGPGADDRFVCRVGFTQTCTGGTCYCRHLPCPKGKLAFRTPTIPHPLPDCVELEGTSTDLEFEYGCEQEVHVLSTASPSSAGDATYSFSPGTTIAKDENDGKESINDDADNNDDDGEHDSDEDAGLIIGVVIGVVVGVVIGVVIVLLWLKKRHSGNYTASNKLAESDECNDSCFLDVEDSDDK